jgi:hypothetical protein
VIQEQQVSQGIAGNDGTVAQKVTWCNRFNKECVLGNETGHKWFKGETEYKESKVILVFKELQDLMVRQVLQECTWQRQVQKVMQELRAQRDQGLAGRCCWSFKGDIGIKEQDPDGATGTKVMQELQVQGLAGTDGAVDLKGIGEAGFTRLQLVLREQMG